MIGNRQRRIQRVLADTDLLIELARGRAASETKINKLFQMMRDRRIEIWATNKCRERIINLELSVGLVDGIVKNRIVDITPSHTEQARQSSVTDFDSAEEVMCAKDKDSGLDAIITLYPDNFDGTDFTIISIQDQTRRRLRGIFGILALLSIGIGIGIGSYLTYKNKESESQSVIEKLGLKQINKEELNEKICKNQEYYRQNIPIEHPEYKNVMNELKITPTGIFSSKELKDLVIPAFTARCGYSVKSGGISKVGGENNISIGLDMSQLCPSTPEKPRIVIPYKWSEDPYSHLCVNTKPE